jgi:hypothetical protein
VKEKVFFYISVFLERDDLLIKSTDVTQSNNNDELQKQRIAYEQQKIELEHLRQVIIERDSIIEQQDKRLLIEHNSQAIQTVAFRFSDITYIFFIHYF